MSNTTDSAFPTLSETELDGVSGGFLGLLAPLLSAAPGILQGVSGIIGAAKGGGGGGGQAAAPQGGGGAPQGGGSPAAAAVPQAPSGGKHSRGGGDDGGIAVDISMTGFR